jgi:hypothetical protein
VSRVEPEHSQREEPMLTTFTELQRKTIETHYKEKINAVYKLH